MEISILIEKLLNWAIRIALAMCMYVVMLVKITSVYRLTFEIENNLGRYLLGRLVFATILGLLAMLVSSIIRWICQHLLFTKKPENFKRILKTEGVIFLILAMIVAITEFTHTQWDIGKI